MQRSPIRWSPTSSRRWGLSRRRAPRRRWRAACARTSRNTARSSRKRGFAPSSFITRGYELLTKDYFSGMNDPHILGRMGKIHVIHENDAWVVPLRAAFDELSLPFEEWHLDEGLLDLSTAPPEGVFYNRMSASSHTRGHRYAPELTAGVLAWLESHGRRVVNDSRALRLEISKIAQYAALRDYGIRTPRTIAAVGKTNIVAAAQRMQGSFITKHNRAGKGLGVKLFNDVGALRAHLGSDAFEDSVDGITLIQEYIRAPEPFITRVEFVGGQFLYAVRVDTSLGFELCPADVCQVGDAFCPVGDQPRDTTPRFRIVRDF